MSIVTVAEVKEQLNQSLDADDDLIQRKIDAAEAYVARYIGQALADLDGDDGFPPDLREAITMLAATLYEQREMALVGVTAQEAPFGFYDLVKPYRVWVFA